MGILKYAVLCVTIVSAWASTIGDIRYKISAGDLNSAAAIADDHRREHGEDAEYAAAVAWLARGAFVLGNTEDSGRYLNEAKRLIARMLRTKRVEDDYMLESAVGTAIEVEARLTMARGERGQAITFLKSEETRWQTFPLRARIYKVLNLLTLEGQPAPELDAHYRGHPVLLFLWAHWCSDCKAQVATIARLQEKYGAKGLQVVAPTRRYGSIGDEYHVPAAKEDAEIDRVWKASYAALGAAPHPISDAMMLRYGVSGTPTLVLIDGDGIVRMYRPTRMTESELSERIEALLPR